jgi:hypothetical protein
LVALCLVKTTDLQEWRCSPGTSVIGQESIR